jgi:6-phosphogluconolactonase
MEMHGLSRKLAALALAACGFAAPAFGQGNSTLGHGVVVTATNETDGNDLVVYRRAPNGTLTQWGTLPTGGNGTGVQPGNQGGIIFARGGHLAYVVNAGSGTISVFVATPAGPVLAQVVDAGGDMPISLTHSGRLLYVLNADGAAGGTDHINGFYLGRYGLLHPIPNSERPLSAAVTGPAQVAFSPDGSKLVVTEKMTNKIDVYLVGARGLAGQPSTQNSAGQTPFGFSFTGQGFLIVSEAFMGAPDASAVSSYSLGASGALTTISASVPTGETAACWIALTGNSGFAYSTNTGSNSISGFAVNQTTGALTPLTPGVPTATSGAAPIDADIVGNRLLYVLAHDSGQINSYRIGLDGSLTPLQTVSGLPTSANGLAAQ